MDSATEELRHRRPLVGLSPQDRRTIYGCSGMHSPNPDIRSEMDAFEVRSDVDVEEACTTALRLTLAAVAQLELLGMTAELPPAFRDAVYGITCLCRLTGGAIGLVQVAICDEPPSRPAI